MKPPTSTPWGRANHTDEIAPGIWLIRTPDHGGIWLSAERLAAMPESLRVSTWAGLPWFEEDCDAARVAVAFPRDFDRSAAAVRFLREAQPNVYAAWVHAGAPVVHYKEEKSSC